MKEKGKLWLPKEAKGGVELKQKPNIIDLTVRLVKTLCYSFNLFLYCFQWSLHLLYCWFYVSVVLVQIILTEKDGPIGIPPGRHVQELWYIKSYPTSMEHLSHQINRKIASTKSSMVTNSIGNNLSEPSSFIYFLWSRENHLHGIIPKTSMQ